MYLLIAPGAHGSGECVLSPVIPSYGRPAGTPSHPSIPPGGNRRASALASMANVRQSVHRGLYRRLPYAAGLLGLRESYSSSREGLAGWYWHATWYERDVMLGYSRGKGKGEEEGPGLPGYMLLSLAYGRTRHAFADEMNRNGWGGFSGGRRHASSARPSYGYQLMSYSSCGS